MAEGYLALTPCGKKRPLQVLSSRAGFYLGTTEDGLPFSRGSQEYWPSRADADRALREGSWRQRRF